MLVIWLATTYLFAAEGPHGFDFASNMPEDPPSVFQARSQGHQSIASWVGQWNTKKTHMPLSSPADILHSNPAFGGYTPYVNGTALVGLAVNNLTATTG